MKTIIRCMMFFFIPLFSVAQQVTFKGKITAEGKPVFGADVILRKRNEVKGTSSKATGEYSIKVTS